METTVAKLSYTYDNAGLMATASSFNSGGSVLNQIADSYDGFGQLANEYQEHDGSVDPDSSQAASYTYDAFNGDRPTSITYPNGREVDYNYDSGLDSILSRISSVSDSDETMQAYTYLGVDTPVTFTDGNGVELSYLGTATSSGTGAGDQYAGLDRFGRVTDQKWTNSSGTIDELQYTYDQDGNVLTKNNMVLTADAESFTYDNLNRLTAFSVGGFDSESWSLDALGNWSLSTINGVSRFRDISAQNQVLSVGGSTLGYDNNGNTLTDQTGQQYVYDGWNRLVTVKDSSGTTIASYQYDAEGRRITETEAGATTDLYYSDRWQVIEEQVAGSTTMQFTWGPFYVNQLIATDTPPTEIGFDAGRDSDDVGDITIYVAGRVYAEQDANYDVTSLTGDDGTVIERYEYDPYGNVTVLTPAGTIIGAGMSSSTVGEIIGYQGGWTDPVTGLVTFQYRDLNTGLGRWIEQDPAGYVNGPNRYQLEVGGPTAGVDPTGLDDDGFGEGVSQALSDLWDTWFGTPQQPGPAAPVGQGVMNTTNSLTNTPSNMLNGFVQAQQWAGSGGLGGPSIWNPASVAYNPISNGNNILGIPHVGDNPPPPALPTSNWGRGSFYPQTDSEYNWNQAVGGFGWSVLLPICLKGLFPVDTAPEPAPNDPAPASKPPAPAEPTDPNSPSAIAARLNQPAPPINWGQQGKHVVGAPNYTPGAGKSILTADPNSLAPYAGWGDPVNNVPLGSPGSKEAVDFGQVIGIYIQQLPDGSFSQGVWTTRGIFHYSNSGVHIVPAPPIQPGG